MKAEDLIYEYQRRRIENTYSDIHGLDDARELFFECVYPHPSRRARFEERNRAFVRSTRNRLLRLVVSKEVRATLEEIIELHNLTNELNSKMSAAISGMSHPPDILDDEMYFELSRRTSTFDQRMRQVVCAINGFKLGMGVVLYFPWNLDQIVRYVPKSLIGNSDLLDFAVRTYKAFYNHKAELYGYLDIFQSRETERIKKMFDKEQQPASSSE